jgi:hypothetical protein
MWTFYKATYVKFEVLKEVLPCSLVDHYQSFGRVGYLFCPEDGSSKFFRNVNNDLPDYTPSVSNLHFRQIENEFH